MTFQGSADLSEPARQRADFTYKIAPIAISIVDSGSGQRSVIEVIGKPDHNWIFLLCDFQAKTMGPAVVTLAAAWP